MTLPNDDWEEIEPCVFQRKKYTQAQLDLLSRRPDKMIQDALATPPLSSHMPRPVRCPYCGAKPGQHHCDDCPIVKGTSSLSSPHLGTP